MEQGIYLTFVIEREDDRYVATCKELDVSSFGRSIEEAVQHLDDAVTLYLDIIEEDGERDRVFRERGIEIVIRMSADYHVDIPVGVFATVRQVLIPSSA